MLHSYENIQNMRTVKKGTAKVAKLKQIKWVTELEKLVVLAVTILICNSNILNITSDLYFVQFFTMECTFISLLTGNLK